MGARLRPELLRDHAELEVAEAGAAVGLGDGGAHPAHLAHALPELDVVGRGAFQDAADAGRGRVLAEELARLLPERFLVGREIEVHGARIIPKALAMRSRLFHNRRLTPHPALSPKGRGGEDGGGHAGDGGGAVRGPEAGGRGGRGSDGPGAARGARALGRQRGLPQRPARDHRGLSPSAAGGAGARGGRGGGEDRGRGRDGEGGRSRVLELHSVVRAVLRTASADSRPCAPCATSRAGSCTTARRASAATASRSTTSCRSRATRPTRCCRSRA